MADMIKFFKGLEASLPTSGVNGALYITTDEGAIYLGTGTGMKRLGDFVQVDNVAALPEKAHESCLYYCVAENILAKWNGAEWKQINKQPTADELKGLLGLGSMAYLSEVSEANLNSDLAAKINAASGAQHSHSNKALLDTYTQTEADLADAVAKKHAHTFNETELNKIAEGDVAKWNGVAADHLTSADKTTLENAIKEAKKAGTDANTNIETYKVSNDARVKAVEDDIAEITDGTNGILAQAKSYADGKDSAIAEAKKAGTDASAALEAYKTSNDTALAGVKATADAAAVKTEVETALAGKVDKVEGKSLISDSEIARLANVTNYDDTQVKADIAKKADAAAMTTELGKKVDKVTGYSLVSDTEIARLAGVDNYDDTAVRGLIKDNADAIDAIEADYLKAADKTELSNAIALKADKSVVEAMYTNDQIDGFLGGKVDKTTYAEDKATFALKSEIASLAGKADKTYVDDELAKKVNVSDYNTDKATFALKTDLNAYRTSADQDVIDQDFEGRIAELEAIDHEQLAKDAAASAVATIRDDAPEAFDTLKEIATWISNSETAAEAADLVTRVSDLEAIDHDAYVDADAELKEELEGKINAINNHSHSFVESELNKIADGDVAKWNNEIGAKELAASKTTTAEVKDQIEAYGYATEADLTLAEGRIATLEAIDHDAYKAADATLKSELQAEIDADVKVVNDAFEAYKTSNDAEVAKKANSADVYTKSETYTKEEINALFTWGEF